MNQEKEHIRIFHYQWDANGNMVNDGGAVLTWDEENRLTGHSKSLKKTCFFYDAAGERYYKNSGSTMMIVNNGVWQMMTFYENPTLYASPYVVATPDGYTKHYYVESERFASRIGDGTITGLNTHAATASVLAAKQAKVDDAAPDSIMPNSFGYLPTLPFNWSSHHTTYWQHSDHLGSASWVTDTNGAAYQHLQYMPWGEPLLDQRKSGYTYNSRYTFSGKERDEETGYSYFGARYYNSDISIWLSVDPLADKYPSMSPYTYCADNPVKLVDPDGREVWILGEDADADSAFARLQQATNLKLTMEDDGKISAEGKPLNANDLQLYRAIKSSKVVVNIETVSDEKDCPNGGQYMGTEYKPGQATSTNSVYLEKLNSYEKPGAEGSGMMHEITEGYQLGLHALEIKRSIDKASLHMEMDGFTIMMGERSYESWHWEPDNKVDYDIFWNYGHTRATQQPSTMTTEQAKYYKYPVFQVIMSHLQNFQR